MFPSPLIGDHNVHFLMCVYVVYGAQSDREKAEGLPVAPFMDREKVTKPTAQIGFIKFVLIPMFETVMKVSMQGIAATEKDRGAAKWEWVVLPLHLFFLFSFLSPWLICKLLL